MEKIKAIEMLGGSIKEAADAIGISYQAVRDWPDGLSDRVADRVHAALARRKANKQPRKPQRKQPAKAA